MAKHSDGRSCPKHLASLILLFLLVGAIALVSNTASAQQPQRSQVRRPAPAERTNTTLDAALPSPPVDKTSALGQALTACNQGSDLQDGLTLPGPKGEIALDRCYKGRAHLACVFTTLGTEARSLTNTYAKIVDANYPEINSVDEVCKLAPETLASNIVGSEDFAKRFRELKSQYAAAASCAGNVELAFKNVALTDMMQAPEILKSMTASIDGDIAKISEVDKQISDLAEKMEASKKAMKTITKIYHTMCLQGERAAEKPGK